MGKIDFPEIFLMPNKTVYTVIYSPPQPIAVDLSKVSVFPVVITWDDYMRKAIGTTAGSLLK